MKTIRAARRILASDLQWIWRNGKTGERLDEERGAASDQSIKREDWETT